jgi:hypothetical protein
LQALIFVAAQVFFCAAIPCFSRGFAILGAQNVVFCVVDDGEIVVKVW